jgi:hypothetical protein
MQLRDVNLAVNGGNGCRRMHCLSEIALTPEALD